ncbi:transcriptional regulator [Isoalcanivorax pacificus W11-5]|jgi:TetR/AcrR family transcriptional regulator, mexJK operon transcriptional repressor|uniref:Transcriptional regulator n=1 Tax=Isoalcanivorax pacificus W11-5 TaxID=391936 RepID=A0A0B4XJ79_9GAMM|nr:TetR/AcrR family transcriptional regulator [Isoalcanivorax pacificus]AJD48349.1 transcriptional regulator [Isoalcanivorax pacificus W11-5]
MTVKVARGRPSDPAKQAAIFEAARALFFRAGPQGMTMEAVARDAEVSKVTVYAYYANRDALIQAIIDDVQQSLFSSLHLPLDDTPGVRRSLAAFGMGLLEFLCSEDCLLLYRILSSTVGVPDEVRQMLYRQGPLATIERLAALLQRLDQRRLLSVPDSVVAAEQLIGMWRGALHEALVFQQSGPPSRAELEKRVHEGLDTFIRAFGKPA